MERVLFVDDEPKILEAYRRTLRKDFKVIPAEGGKQALELLANEEPFPVIVSDMNMPEMNGVQFLAEVKKRYPQSIRIMLTGNADQETASQAINVGDVYRFLNKPCPPDKMTVAINEALGYYRLMQAERELLEETVRGSVLALSEILSMAKPAVFGRVNRIKNLASRCCQQMGLENQWEVETAASLSQVGLVALPDDLQEKIIKGESLTDEEQKLYITHPKVASNLIQHIPRMESIADAVNWQTASFSSAGGDGAPCGADIPIASRVIKPVVDYLAHLAKAGEPKLAHELLVQSSDQYDPEVIAALSSVLEEEARGVVRNLNVAQIRAGMTLAQDVSTSSGALLIETGFEISETMVTRLVNFWRNGEIPEQLAVYVPEENDSNAA